MKTKHFSTMTTSSRFIVALMIAALGATKCIASPSEAMPVHMLMISVTVSGAGTNSAVSVTLGPTQTFINTPYNDFEAGVTKSFLRLGDIRKVSDISGMTIRVHGSDGLKIAALTLYLNGPSWEGQYKVFERTSSDPLIIIGGNKAFTIGGPELRSNIRWKF